MRYFGPLLTLTISCAAGGACQSGHRPEPAAEQHAPGFVRCDGTDDSCPSGAGCLAGACQGDGLVKGRIFLNGTTLEGPLFVGLYPVAILGSDGFNPSDAVAGATYEAPADPQPFSIETTPTGERVLVAYSIFPSAAATSRVAFGSVAVDVQRGGSVVVDGERVTSVNIYIIGATALAD